MAATVEYYFAMNSVFAFIGHDTFMNLAANLKFTIVYRPVALAEVFEHTGGLPLAKRHPARQAYRLIEMQRWGEKRGMSFKLKPKHFPFDSSLADRTVIAVAEAGQNPAPFMAMAFRSVWERDENLADEEVVAANLEKVSLKGKPLIEAARSDKVGELYKQYTETAIEKMYFGSPCYVLNGEPFWGQDRLNFVERAVAGR